MPPAFRTAFQFRAHGAGLLANLPTAASRRILIDHCFRRSSQLHEDDVLQQYYIATKSSPAEDRARVQEYGRLFFVLNARPLPLKFHHRGKTTFSLPPSSPISTVSRLDEVASLVTCSICSTPNSYDKFSARR